jgi:hypothetical protein
MRPSIVQLALSCLSANQVSNQTLWALIMQPAPT